MKTQNKSGFTLIELLVVITIIGILATGATATYTSQIQKARDTTRVNDLKAIESAANQYYGDASEYPDKISTGTVGTYMPKIPKDSKTGQTGAKGAGSTGTPILNYGYARSADDNGVTNQRFEVSTAFENKGNVDNKAAKDSGNDPDRLEVGIPNSTGSLNINTSDATAFSGVVGN